VRRVLVAEHSETPGDRERKRRWTWGRLQSLIISFVVSGVLAPILSFVTKSSTGVTIVFGVCCFVALEVIQLGEKVVFARQDAEKFRSAMAGISADAGRMAAIIARGETRIEDRDQLASLAHDVSRLDDGSRSRAVVAGIIRENISHVNSMARQALSDSRVSIDFASLSPPYDQLFSVFQGNEAEDYFWAALTADQITSYRTVIGEMFLRNIDHALTSRKITEARRLLVFRRPKDLDSELMATCMYLHLRSGYSTKLISHSDFAEVTQHSVPHEIVHDFEIYGTHLVWETAYSPDDLIQRGTISFAPEVVRRYHVVYSSLWSVATDYPDDLYAKYSCDKLENHHLGDFRSLWASR
jgi:hypothetical protein